MWVGRKSQHGAIANNLPPPLERALPHTRQQGGEKDDDPFKKSKHFINFDRFLFEIPAEDSFDTSVESSL